MDVSPRAKVLLLLFCLGVGAVGGVALAEWFVEWQNLPSNDPRELLATGLFLLMVGGGLGCYFACIAAVRPMIGRADRQGAEADYDDKPAAD